MFLRVWSVVWLFLGFLLEYSFARNASRMNPTAWDAARWETFYRRQAVRFRETAERMGGLLIKVGQFLSSRVDLLPKAYVNELQALQDRVQPSPWPEVHRLLEEEWPDFATRFAAFDPTPVAAASLGQVYRAELHDGTAVAVKVQRPHIGAVVGADLRAIRLVVGILARFTRMGRQLDLGTVFREFRRTVRQELDYQAELANTERLRRDLADLPWLHVPRTFPDHSTRRVLTMAFWEGIKVNQRETLEQHGIAPALVAERLIHLYLHMVMETGFFHADPHPGNILVRDNGDLVLLDYGMVGRLELAERRQIRRLFVAVSQRHAGNLVDSLWALGMVRPHADRRQLKKQVAYLLDRYYAETLSQVLNLDVAAMVQDFETLLQEDAIQVPGHLAFLGRAIAILVGLATALDPDINLVQLFAPYAQRFMTEDSGGTAAALRGRVESTLRNLVEFPQLSTRVLRRFDTGEVEVEAHWDEGRQQLRDVERALSGLTHAVVFTGALTAGALLVLAHANLAADLLFILAALAALRGWWHRRR